MTEKKSLKLTPMGGDPLLGIVRTSIMRGTGMETTHLGRKPLIAIANSHTEMTTGLAPGIAGALREGGGINRMALMAPGGSIVRADPRFSRGISCAGRNRPISTRWDGRTSYTFVVPRPPDRRTMPETWYKASR